jgi:hypothetical protein
VLQLIGASLAAAGFAKDREGAWVAELERLAAPLQAAVAFRNSLMTLSTI